MEVCGRALSVVDANRFKYLGQRDTFTTYHYTVIGTSMIMLITH